MVKKGDTLIEVALAIGVFSMIAISIASVISSSTSGAQLSLETTLAREEIDTQAETLRFIHNAYASNKEGTNRPLSSLWETIVGNAIDISDMSEDKKTKILQYSPQTCDEIYNAGDNPIYDHAFIINPRELNDGLSSYYGFNSGKLTHATTYPRLIFGDNRSNSDSGKLISDNSFTRLYHAEGIYVVAVKDPDTTYIVNIDKENPTLDSAYYDFYIRTCWYGTGNDEPSTISTVIRLHNPNITVNSNWAYVRLGDGQRIPFYGEYRLTMPEKTPGPGWEFKGWCRGEVKDGVCNGTLYNVGDVINGDNDEYILQPVWSRIKYQIKYDLGYDSTLPIQNTICYQDEDCTVSNVEPTRSGYRFDGWCMETLVNGSCPSSKLSPGTKLDSSIFPQKFSVGRTLELHAVWKEFNETIQIKLRWGLIPLDLDSHVYGQKSDNSYFHTYYNNKTYSEGKVISSLDDDIKFGYGPETVILNTLGGKTYYYYVHNFSSGCGTQHIYCFSSASVTGAEVEVTNLTTGEVRNYYSDSASGSGVYWNVFAYKDGQIINRQTRSDSPQTSY